MTRIKYTVVNNGIIKSNDLICNDDELYVLISPNSLYYTIHSRKNSDQIVQEGFGANIRIVKKTIRKQLIELGVKFKNEVRPRI